MGCLISFHIRQFHRQSSVPTEMNTVTKPEIFQHDA